MVSQKRTRGLEVENRYVLRTSLWTTSIYNTNITIQPWPCSLYHELNNYWCQLERLPHYLRYSWMDCISVRIARGVEPPYLILPTPLPLVKIRPRGARVSTPPPKFFWSWYAAWHFLPMQFLKYLHCDDLNVTTILIHIEDYGLFSPGLSVKFY